MNEDKVLARAKGLAYRLLAIRPRSRAELLTYLKGKEFPEDIVEEVMQVLERYGYVDDLKFAAQYARHIRETKGLSRYALKMELRKKGVSPEDIGAALDGLAGEGDEDEEAVALRVARKKMASMSDLDKEKSRRRLVDNLRRKGFGFDIIRKVISML